MKWRNVSKMESERTNKKATRPHKTAEPSPMSYKKMSRYHVKVVATHFY